MTDELRDGRVYRLDLGYVNAYLVDDGTVTLVDAGMPGDADDLRAALAGAGYEEADVDRVLITHYDVDHVGALAHVAVDAPTYAVEPDASFLDGTRKPPLSRRKGIMHRLIGLRLTRPSSEVRRLGDGETLGGFTAYPTPGHTPGHAAYVHEDLAVGLLGDLVTGDDGRLSTPPWYLSYSARENARSVRALAERDLPIDAVAMGHGRPIAEGGARALSDLAARLA